MPLSVAEKQHWKDRIAARIKAAVERIRGRHPATFDALRRRAQAEALESLGLAAPHAALEALRAEEEAPDVAGVRYCSGLPLPAEVAEALDRRRAAHLDTLMAGDDVGREVRRLEAEQERLLDTVWLACSPREVRELWARVGALLGDGPTAPGSEALALPAPGGA